MQIYCLFEADNPEEELTPNREAIIKAFEAWQLESRSIARLIDQIDQQLLGFDIDTVKKKTLIKPLEFFYLQAKEYQLDCVIGLEEQGQREDICYFGFHEGKPDIHEIGQYLGLEK